MHPSLSQPSSLLRRDDGCAKDLEHDIAVVQHWLNVLPLADDQPLGDLLDRHPIHATDVYRMGRNLSHPNEWQTGEIACSGQALLAEIKAGRLVVIVRGVANHDDFTDAIVQRLFQELSSCAPTLRPSQPSTDLVLASPSAMIYFNIDQRPTLRWQLRGSHAISTYPKTHDVVDAVSLQDIVLDGTGTGLYYEPEMSREAQTYLIEAGQMISLPHGTPYHIDAHDELCVWLQTSFHTPQSIRQAKVFATNRRLRPVVPQFASDASTHGCWSSLKCGVATAFGWPQQQATQKYDKNNPRHQPTFRVTSTHDRDTRSTDSHLTRSRSTESNLCLPIAGTMAGSLFDFPTHVVSEI